MSFMYPMGLLVLIGIPIVILIYILRNKYNEQTVTSTYIWKLSDKFLKRRNPLSGLTGLISLILQILTVAVIALAVARPVFVLPNAAYDYYFVLDASSSMQMENGEETRFDVAKEEIKEVIKDSKNGSSYTLICVSNETIVEFERVNKKDTAIELLQEVEASDASVKTADVLKEAQRIFDDNSSALIYLVTDKAYAECGNVELIHVAGDGQRNYAITDLTYSHAGGQLKASANVMSYAGADVVTVALYVDGNEAGKKLVGTQQGVPTPVEFMYRVENFRSFEMKIIGADAYALDNSVVAYNLESGKTYNTLIVSEQGFFLEAVIDAVLDSEITVVTPKEYEQVTTQYGLYIFDSYEPKTLPDSAVWLINADSNIENSGYAVRGKIENKSAVKIDKSTSTATDVRKLLESVDGNGISITNYVKSSMYLPFRTLFSCESNSVIFAGMNGLGNRQVVFGFDLHESDIALSTDFVILIRNLLEYSFPDALDKTNYVVGDEAIINILANTEYAKAIAPSGKEIFVDTETATTTVALAEVGTYVVKMTVAGVENTYNFYVTAHPEESVPHVEEGAFIVAGEKGNEKIDGEFDATTLLFILLAVLFVADWGVYCYEKYQLR